MLVCRTFGVHKPQPGECREGEHELNEKQTRAKYTLEFKQEAVRQVKAGRAASAVATTLGMPKASLTNWVCGPMRRASWR